MKARQYQVTLTGDTPLLMHADNLEWSAPIKKWQNDPANKKLQVSGDDRSPAWTWLSYLYRGMDGLICIPSDNLMTMLREGGAKCPTGKGRATFKALTQSGIIVDRHDGWAVVANGETVSFADLEHLMNEPTDFEKHEETVKQLGFELFVKRAKIGMNGKHVRVRPRFNQWACSGTVTVLEETITKDALTNILTFAGRYSGIGDWRPSSKAAGRFGQFSVEIKEVA